MKEQAMKEESLFTENVLASTSSYDRILGREVTAVPSNAEAFLTPDSKLPDYDFRYIDRIYQKYNPALQLPVFSHYYIC